ncbi:MAG: DUF547 domain-containing protein [Pseudomonadales bacterium]|jgi:hypothetical protein|nr:DUF547 domain-containing protein [Pseudomonadales bacterium]MDP7360775.1 DUF547 domain-containing protein [Pseudomonadales bacterium]HJN50648.1 DUF547 domain-containing protein [Pseudomonadales bacterium]|tara:strand:+ start:1374 stop:2132 length:759 start_codon:yes stop_codon:yes gene_type:complete
MKMLAMLLATCLSVAWPAQVPGAEGAAYPIDWDLYDQLLSEYVSVGEKQRSPVNMVDYSNLKKDPRLQVLIDQISSYPQSELKSRDEKISFFVNAYNVLTIKVILDHWPVAGIRDIGSWIRDAWDIPVIEVNGQKKSLDDIENRILRPMGEARIHFALNCASVSCPDLRLEAYRAELLYSQLDDQVARFISPLGKGTKLEGDVLHLSKIFKWYDDDFDEVGGVQEFIRERRTDITFKRIKTDLDYNWDLNGY